MSADGTRGVYLAAQYYSNLWLAQYRSPDNGGVAVRGLKIAPVTKGTSWFEWPGISPDGRWIAYATEGHISRIPTQGGTPTRLTFSEATEASPAWSPDGKRIAYGSNEGGSYKVWIVDADGANRRQFAKTQLSDGSFIWSTITWSPDRNILYQRPGSQGFNVLNPETGEEKPLFKNGSGGLLFGPKYSPDGKEGRFLLDADRAHGLSVFSPEEDLETPLYGSYSPPAGWSVDGKSIYAYSANEMMAIPTAGGVPHTVFTAPEEIAAASVSPDGKNFVFSVAETKSDVWIVDNFDPAYTRK